MDKKINIFCAPNNIGINSEIPCDFSSQDSNIYSFTYESINLQEKNILHIISKTKDFSKPGFLYASLDEHLSEENRLFSSQNLGNNELYINLEKYIEKTTIYILVKRRKATTYASDTININVELLQKIVLSDTNPKAKFKLSHISKVYYTVPPTITHDSILFYSIAEDWNFLDMKVMYKGMDNSIRVLNARQIIETGHGIIVNLNKIGTGNEITLNLTALENAEERKVEVGFEYVDQEKSYLREVHLLERVYGVTELSKNCYKFNESLVSGDKPVLLINALTQEVTVDIYKSDSQKLFSINVFDNSYIRLNDTFNEMDYFCIKKYSPLKDGYEIPGESSYNFQLYYENKLQENQMFIMSLSNGRIFTHTLKKDSIMVYRHDVYAAYLTDIKIYSANLNIIKGNPKLYGYACITYPDCTVVKEDIPNLEEVERINRYYVLKKKDAVGNINHDENGEAANEIRKQYLSVVICDTESSDPDNGECEYTIEINNQGEDTQLAPEKIMATTFMPGENYFSVRIFNHEEIKYLNISLTVLTGNAYMKVYYDYYNYFKVTNYKYHKVFRKEVFEFISGDIKERYWSIVYCTEPSFIELTYTTNFHYKGYEKTNPGEINIEYIIKNENLYSYKIINPYYYPLLTNKDFWFKIRTKECSMIYSYNNKINSDIKAVDMIFDRNQPESYQPEYTFMSTVDKYNYNTNDDSTDCSMFVYSGELNSEERPLLIISDYPIPSDFDNNYYIYPFYKDENFLGIMIDIRFINNNNGNLNYNVKLIVNKTTIIEKDINKDEIILVDPNDSNINCGGNLQCNLKIQIKKNQNSDKTYNFTLNVYSPKSSLPELVDTTEISNKIYISKGGSKTVKVAIGKNQETEIKFSFSSGEGKVQAKLIPKSQFNDYSNYIFDDNDSSNMLVYDSKNRLLRITKEESDKCDGGCELVIALKVDNTDEDLSQVTITQGPLTDKREEEKKDSKIEPWLAAVLVVVCVVFVAGSLILVYMVFLREKNVTNLDKPVEESKKEFKNIKETKSNNEQIISREGEQVIKFS